jgi:hypothetical protein
MAIFRGTCSRCGRWGEPSNLVTESWLDVWRTVSRALCQECWAPSEERTESCGCRVLIIKLAPTHPEYASPHDKKLYPGCRRRVLQECHDHRDNSGDWARWW